MNLGMPEIILILLVVVLLSGIIYVIPAWIILKKAGFNPLISLFVLIPVLNIVLLYYFAFTPWPILGQNQQ
jgi:hypothetical protein